MYFQFCEQYASDGLSIPSPSLSFSACHWFGCYDTDQPHNGTSVCRAPVPLVMPILPNNLQKRVGDGAIAPWHEPEKYAHFHYPYRGYE